MRWKNYPGKPGIQAPLSCSGHYVISHRPNQFTVSFRPPGQHHHVAHCETLEQAKQAAKDHADAPVILTGQCYPTAVVLPPEWHEKGYTEVPARISSTFGGFHIRMPDGRRLIPVNRWFSFWEVRDAPTRLETEAAKIGDSKTLLRKRLNECKSCLKTEYAKRFRKPTYDFPNKRLVSDDGRLFLQWFNDGATSIGGVSVYEVGAPEPDYGLLASF